ncbi:hypothetical protein Pmar_PMAR026998 [Perkinsus marinus ATCC 50983]|uniref:Uncharacterized protein n=1 Tax=Perkinsus marinus (strain ATCC 50983 / TXsc) TaxID=423536 RepID=C5K458_PERM5|nr:hypothetical protein Pmar_PMAR026998 [Perkinsus marinus ATCC 50983]EER20735.1 hypothetical protein Pmar_PMAR026998 [Perkinsus marinus ATCC 50983]|eukprot:XP_002788939.1 hypothetical protein Pmar_PMAR026998 [Perkinsus marinus ATCC 50983]
MLRALNDRDVSEDVDEQTLCKAQLKAFADHMYITSEKYQQDARKLGIDPQSESFIAWSILNLRKENFFERRIGEPDIGKICEIDASIGFRFKTKTPHETQYEDISITATHDRDNIMTIDSFAVGFKQ